MESLYTRIRDEAKKKGLTGKDIGKLLGLKKSPLTDWKNGKSFPTTEQIIELCDIFAASADYLLFGIINTELSEEEVILLSKFKNLSDSEKQEVIGFIDYKIYQSKEKEEKSSPSKSSERQKAI